MKVLWLTNIPSPYRVHFFNELGKYCDLTVLFEKRASAERDDSWKQISTDHYRAVFLKGVSIGVAEAFCPAVVKYLNRSYDRIVVTNYSDPTGMLAIAFMKMSHIPYEIEGDGAFPGSRKGIKAHLKQYVMSEARHYFSTADLHDQYYRMYGAKDERIVRYPFSSVYQSEILPRQLLYEKKQEIRNMLGMHGTHVVLAVGQFIHRKGYDVLIKSAKYLPENYEIYILGGVPTKEYIDLIQSCGVKNVHFVEFRPSDELEYYFEAADVFVHPTREDIWGLVVNEAMAKGLPVVSTDRCIAALEMIEDGVNGKIVPVEDERALAEAVEMCVSRQSEMAHEALKKVACFTIEKMVGSHISTWLAE